MQVSPKERAINDVSAPKKAMKKCRSEELTEKWQNKAEVNNPSVHPNQIEQWTMRNQVNSGFTLLSPTSLAWQFLHNSQSFRMKTHPNTT
jgi:hypothetical protein